MGEAKQKRMIQDLAQSLAAEVDDRPSARSRDSLAVSSRELVSSESGRERLNLSVSPQLRRGLRAAADSLGMTESQIALQALVAGLPQLQQQVRALSDLVGGEDSGQY